MVLQARRGEAPCSTSCPRHPGLLGSQLFNILCPTGNCHNWLIQSLHIAAYFSISTGDVRQYIDVHLSIINDLKQNKHVLYIGLLSSMSFTPLSPPLHRLVIVSRSGLAVYACYTGGAGGPAPRPPPAPTTAPVHLLLPQLYRPAGRRWATRNPVNCRRLAMPTWCWWCLG